MVRRDHRRMHAHRHLAVEALGHGEQLHDVAQVVGGRDVVGGDLGDAFPVHIVGDDASAEGDGRDDRSLGRGVVALNVGGRIPLRVAERLCLGEGVVERRALFRHAGEDVVGRPVHDPGHAPDAIPRQGFAQRANERDAAGDGRLEEKIDARAFGRLEELLAGVGEELLVGRHDGLPGLERLGDERACRLDPADHLDDDVDVGVGDDGLAVLREPVRRERHVSLAARVAHGDTGHFEVHARALLDQLGVLLQQTNQRRADVPAAEQADPHGLVMHRVCHHASLALNARRGA